MRICTALAFLCFSAVPVFSAPPLDHQFTQVVQPFLNQYCVACHSGKAPAGSLDLKAYGTFDSVVRDYLRWDVVHDKLAAGQMPPKQMPQPSPEARKQVVEWIHNVRSTEAKKNAGDPGPILARRLSNAEYDYTIRDLTGVDIQPAREFPVDPANQAGFDNSGESLSMSPALLNKYLQAARAVGDRMVLTPDGFDFAPFPMLVETDREKYAIQRIVDFYKRQPTDYADYFEAAWRYKNRLALGKPTATLASVATDAKISPKYLPVVWGILEDQTDEVGPVLKLRTMWRALPAPGADSQALHTQCVAMRDFVVKIRNHTAMQFAAPKVRGLAATSQPLMNWKLYQFAAHRRDFDPGTLRMASDPPLQEPTIPRLAGLGQEAAIRWKALTLKARIGDEDLIVPDGQRPRYEAAFAKFANVFPDAFYISERGRFFPDDSEDKGRLLSAGFHNVMGYMRDDTPLQELILDEKGKKQLDRLWQEFEFIGDYTTRTWVQYYFNQSGEVRGEGRESGTERPSDKAVSSEAVIMDLKKAYLAKADAPTSDPPAMQAIRDHFDRVNAAIREVEKERADAQPLHLAALEKFAARAYRRPLSKAEKDDILAYYHQLRDKEGLSHEDAIRDSLVSILMSPDFCYRIDLYNSSRAPIVKSSVATARPISGYDLASRLSYFLWSSMPDPELLRVAGAGELQKPAVIAGQTTRMLHDARSRALAVEFAGNWLDFRHFEQHNAVDRERFPSFTNDLREAMYEEPIRLITDAIQNNRSVLDLIYGNYTFVNPVLAKHYGMPEVKGGPDTWVRVDDASNYGRGGLLPMAVFLTQNSPGLRTSPVKRGYWVVHKVLGEVVPPPPPNVPELPSDEGKADLPLRDLLAKHRSNPVCASCHARFDAFGLAFEGYGPVGEARTRDLGGRPVDTKVDFPGGAQGDGFAGLKSYIREHRQAQYIDNICRKLLAYSLGRTLMISDEPLLDKMKSRLAADSYRMDSLVETIVTSPQFLDMRGPQPRERNATASNSDTSNRKGE